jgi:hypothetical protein
MSAEQAIKTLILRDLKTNDVDGSDPFAWPETISEENADTVWDAVDDHERLADWLSEMLGEFRGTGEAVQGLSFGDTYSRHYEAYRVVRQLDDGRWVGWIYWYGGGKHGDPGAIDWLPSAVLLSCKEEEKLVTIRTFTEI